MSGPYVPQPPTPDGYALCPACAQVRETGEIATHTFQAVDPTRSPW